MQLFHTAGRLSVSFDEPNLVGSAGLVPAMGLARRLGLVGLADQWLTVPGGRGTAGLKLVALVADGGGCRFDSGHGPATPRGMSKLFTGVRAPST